jgi:hypothetical protein
MLLELMTSVANLVQVKSCKQDDFVPPGPRIEDPEEYAVATTPRTSKNRYEYSRSSSIDRLTIRRERTPIFG